MKRIWIFVTVVLILLLGGIGLLVYLQPVHEPPFRWQLIEKGMTEQQVDHILGRPPHTTVAGKEKVWWENPEKTMEFSVHFEEGLVKKVHRTAYPSVEKKKSFFQKVGELFD